MEHIIYYILSGILLVAALVLLLIFGSRMRGISERLRGVEEARQEHAAITARQDMLIDRTETSLRNIMSVMNDNEMQSEQKLENLRRTLSESMQQIKENNNTQLESIRKTVDEKLQDTLDKKLNESFKLVSERLEQVYKGLGEMQSLASGVGDLKKVLSNVKTRGILGEIQLGAILEQMLSPEQYAANVMTRPGSGAYVEYAVKMPGGTDGEIWLPIDSKFPIDAYEQLLEAYESGSAESVASAQKALRVRVKSFAKDIQSKYIAPPDTTDFAIMFLPTEGLYAELVRIGMVEELQQSHKVNIAGPTTMGALLNSLQMGFRTLAIQKRSSEVWQILGAVKAEFENFSAVLENTQKRITQANEELDKLIGVRTRKIQSTLRRVQSLPAGSEYLDAEDGENV
ncbi:MAG: DNA recombination protein RmuC [Clostridia bacterium]|nr:DNA recombination protein RmuC [Clostridia bacterium]